MAPTKATKKFEKRHLKDALKRRNDFAKTKQRHQLNAKRKARRQNEADSEQDGQAGEDEGPPSKRQKSNVHDLGAMSVDDFFAESVQLPTKQKHKKKGSKHLTKKHVKHDDEERSDADSAASLEEDTFMNGMQSDEDGSQVDVGKEDELNTHKDELKALADKDPEFYKYLQENDAELLEFAEDSNLRDMDDLLSASEDEVSEKKAKKSEAGSGTSKFEMTIDQVQKWVDGMAHKHSLRCLRELVLAFRAAAHLNEEDGKEYKYTIPSADVYHEVLMGALNKIPTLLNLHLPVKELPSGRIKVNIESNKFRKLNALLKSHIASVLHLLENLSDSATVIVTLKSILELLPYILSFKKAVKELMKVVVDVWSDSAQSEITRINAFLVIHRLTVIGDAGIKENVLRTVYQGLVKGSRTTTIHNISAINLMKNSAAGLWGLVDGDLAYTTAFTFIRQLAIHLRNSIKNNSNEAYKTIYNWQYIHSLDFWSRVLTLYCDSFKEASSGKESTLKPIIYPLTQVTLGAMRLIPTAAYFPLRFQLIRSLLRLSQATNTFIPLATPLYEVLTSTEMKKAPKPSTLRPLDFDVNIRAAKSYLRTRVYQDGVGEQITELMAEFFNLWAKNIAFPELALPVIVMLKRWLKEVSSFAAAPRGKSKGKPFKGPQSEKGNRNNKLNNSVALLIQKLEANSRWVEERRAKVNFAVNNRADVEGFLKEVDWYKTPLGAFVEGQRKQKEERKKVLEESRKQEEDDRRKDKEDQQMGEEAFGQDLEDDSENTDEDSISGIEDEDKLEEDLDMLDADSDDDEE